MRTNVDGVYAIGDVTAKLMLAHVAESMGIVAAEVIAGAETMPLDYRMIPRATYCHPQVASMGLTEQQAKDAGHEVKVASFPFTANGKAMGLGSPVGFVKVVADAEHNEIIGAHMIGPGVTELLPVLTLAQQWEREGQTSFRSLADYIAPVESGRVDYLGGFAVSAFVVIRPSAVTDNERPSPPGEGPVGDAWFVAP